jgi:hypothetical protein
VETARRVVDANDGLAQNPVGPPPKANDSVGIMNTTEIATIDLIIIIIIVAVPLVTFGSLYGKQKRARSWKVYGSTERKKGRKTKKICGLNANGANPRSDFVPSSRALDQHVTFGKDKLASGSLNIEHTMTHFFVTIVSQC